jgi:hypothetical protein
MHARIVLFAPLLLALAAFGPPAAAQTASIAPAPSMFSAATLAVCAKIRDAALDDDYAYQRVADLADTIGPRLSGSPAAAAAVTYVQKQFQALGVTTRLQPVMVPHWVRGAELASLTSWPGQPPGLTQRVFVTALGTSPATPQTGIEAPVVVVPDFATLERLGRAGVEGKIVLFDEKYDVAWRKPGFRVKPMGTQLFIVGAARISLPNWVRSRPSSAASGAPIFASRMRGKPTFEPRNRFQPAHLLRKTPTRSRDSVKRASCACD